MPYVRPDTAVVEYVSLVCAEMPEARFNDILRCELPAGARQARVPLDPVFVSVCAPQSVCVVGWSADAPVVAAVSVDRDILEVKLSQPLSTPVQFVVHLSGVRKYAGERFRRFSEEDMRRNIAFWESWKKQPLDS